MKLTEPSKVPGGVLVYLFNSGCLFFMTFFFLWEPLIQLFVLLQLLANFHMKTQNWAIYMTIMVRPRTVTMKLAPSLVPRTRFKHFSKLYFSSFHDKQTNCRHITDGIDGVTGAKAVCIQKYYISCSILLLSTRDLFSCPWS